MPVKTHIVPLQETPFSLLAGEPMDPHDLMEIIDGYDVEKAEEYCQHCFRFKGKLTVIARQHQDMVIPLFIEIPLFNGCPFCSKAGSLLMYYFADGELKVRYRCMSCGLVWEE